MFFVGDVSWIPFLMGPNANMRPGPNLEPTWALLAGSWGPTWGQVAPGWPQVWPNWAQDVIPEGIGDQFKG